MCRHFPAFTPNLFILPFSTPIPLTLKTLSRFCFGLNSLSSRTMHTACSNGAELLGSGLRCLLALHAHCPLGPYSDELRLPAVCLWQEKGITEYHTGSQVELCAAAAQTTLLGPTQERSCGGDRKSLPQMHIMPCLPDKMCLFVSLFVSADIQQ